MIGCGMDAYPMTIDSKDTMVNFRGEINQIIGTSAGNLEPFKYIFNLDVNQDSVDDLQFSVIRRENKGIDFHSHGMSAGVTSLNNEMEIIAWSYPDSTAQYQVGSEQFSETWIEFTRRERSYVIQITKSHIFSGQATAFLPIPKIIAIRLLFSVRIRFRPGETMRLSCTMQVMGTVRRSDPVFWVSSSGIKPIFCWVG